MPKCHIRIIQAGLAAGAELTPAPSLRPLRAIEAVSRSSQINSKPRALGAVLQDDQFLFSHYSRAYCSWRSDYFAVRVIADLREKALPKQARPPGQHIGLRKRELRDTHSHWRQKTLRHTKRLPSIKIATAAFAGETWQHTASLDWIRLFG